MTTACRFVPTPRMANLRTAAAASGSPPLPLPEDAARPRAGGAGNAALKPAGATLALRSRRQCLETQAVWRSITQQGSGACIFTCTAYDMLSGLNYSSKYLKKGSLTIYTRLPPPTGPHSWHPISLPSVKPNKASSLWIFFFF